MEGLERTIQNPNQSPTWLFRTIRKRGRRGRRRKKKEEKQLKSGLFNLTNLEFSESELEVLSQGLKFAPNKNINKFNLFIDIEKYIRKLNIRKHFSGHKTNPTTKETEDPFVHSSLKNNSVFNPKKGSNQYIEVFRNMVQDEVRLIETSKQQNNQKIWEGIKKLEENKQIVVRPADKGGGLVILTKENYNKELQRLLRDTTTYKLLKSNPTTKLKKELLTWISKGTYIKKS